MLICINLRLVFAESMFIGTPLYQTDRVLSSANSLNSKKLELLGK